MKKQKKGIKMPITNQDNDVRDAIAIVRQGLGAEHPLLNSNYGSNIIKKLDNAKSVDDVRNALNGSLSGAGRETYSNVLKGLDNIKQGGSIDQLSSAAKAAGNILADRSALEKATNNGPSDGFSVRANNDINETLGMAGALSNPGSEHRSDIATDRLTANKDKAKNTWQGMTPAQRKYVEGQVAKQDEEANSQGNAAQLRYARNNPKSPESKAIIAKNTWQGMTPAQRKYVEGQVAKQDEEANSQGNAAQLRYARNNPKNTWQGMTPAQRKYVEGATRIPTGNPPSKSSGAPVVIPSATIRRNISSGRAI